MKDKTHSMNQDRGGGVIPNSEMVSERARLLKRDRKAGMKGPDVVGGGSFEVEDEGTFEGGFLPRNNYKDRF